MNRAEFKNNNKLNLIKIMNLNINSITIHYLCGAESMRRQWPSSYSRIFYLFWNSDHQHVS